MKYLFAILLALTLSGCVIPNYYETQTNYMPTIERPILERPTMQCFNCKGTGTAYCGYCQGKGHMYGGYRCPYCINGLTRCTQCNGKGYR